MNTTTRAHHVDERTVELSHGTTRYFEAGSGRTVLLLHGVGYVPASVSWLPVIERLASDRHRVVAPDFVGWGPGGGLDQGYSFAYLVDFVREFQDALGIERCDVVGHSMGGWVASIFAYESPERVDHLVLVASGGIATRPLTSMTAWTPPTDDEVRADLQFLDDHGIDVEPHLGEALRRAGDDERLERYRRIKEHMTVPSTRARYATTRRLERVTAPTLVLWGDEDDINDLELGRRTHELVAGSQLVVGEGLDHFLPQQDPDFVADALRTFLPA